MRNIFNYIGNVFSRYCNDRSGAIALAFAVSFPVIVGSVGMALDLGQAYLIRQRLSAALDAAALAGAATSRDEAAIEARIEQFFEINYPDVKIGDAQNLEIEFTEDDEVIVSADAVYDVSFMRVLGIKTLTVSSSSTIQRAMRTNIELSLVLDLSNSMNSNNRLEDLKDAAHEMVDIIVQEDQDIVFSKIAIVPYGTAVNVGTYANSVRGTYTNNASNCTTTCRSPGGRYYNFRRQSDNAYITHQISTCVTERTGIDYRYTDDAPDTAATRVGRHYPPSGTSCSGLPVIMPMTSDIDALHDKIDALTAAGSTGGQVGVAWGWYMLSPNFAYLWPDEENEPVEYLTENVVKIMVLMTDGEYNSPYYNGVIARDATNGSGSTAVHINTNSSNGSSYYQSQQLCTAMKAADKGVVVYTVGFDIENTQNARDLVDLCATDLSKRYLPENGDELADAFRDIAGDIMTVYVSR